MTPDYNLFLMIDAYVRGAMTLTEVGEFEQRMANDAALQRHVAEHAELWHAVAQLPDLERWQWLANNHPDALAILVKQDLALEPELGTNFSDVLLVAQTLAAEEEAQRAAQLERDRSDQDRQADEQERNSRRPDFGPEM